MAKLTIACGECLSTTRVEKIGPRTSATGFSACPVCGGRNIVAQIDRERDYWETMGEALDLPASLVKELFELWDSKEYSSFKDFVREFERTAIEASA